MIVPKGFQPDPHRLAGNTQSGHGLVFGRLNDQVVAVKPFADGDGIRERVFRARHEERMYRLVHDLGYQTLQLATPQAVIEDEEVAFLVTNFKPNLVPASALSLGSAESIATNQGAIDGIAAITGITRILANLHNDQVTHGDAKPRNFSLNRVTGGDPVVVDLEAAQDHRSSQRANEYFAGAIRGDTRSWSYSLGFQGFGGHRNRPAIQLFDEVVLGTYDTTANLPLTPSTLEITRNAFTAGRQQFFGKGSTTKS